MTILFIQTSNMYSKEGEDAILTWVKSFPFGSEVKSLEELANGSIMAKILNRDVFDSLFRSIGGLTRSLVMIRSFLIENSNKGRSRILQWSRIYQSTGHNRVWKCRSLSPQCSQGCWTCLRILSRLPPMNGSFLVISQRNWANRRDHKYPSKSTNSKL